MPTPEDFSRATISNSFAVSDSVSDAVGSSRIKQPNLREEGLRDLDHLLVSARELSNLAVRDRDRSQAHGRWSAPSRASPRRLRKPPLLISRPRKRFCSTVSSGTRLNSWNTGLMPIVRALCGIRCETGRAAVFEGSGIRRKRAGDNIDQGRLAGAVLAKKNVHLAALYIEIDAVERNDARKPLGDTR